MTKLLHILSISTGLDSFSLFEVDALLHHRGSDFTVYRNDYALRGVDVMTERDSQLLQAIVYSLMASDSCGVEHIYCENYSIKVHHSRAVSRTYIYKTVLEACRDAGYLPIEKAHEAGSPYRGMRASEMDPPYIAAMVLWRSVRRASMDLLRTLVRGLRRVPRKLGSLLPGAVKNFLQI